VLTVKSPHESGCDAVLHVEAALEVARHRPGRDAAAARQRVRLDADVLARVQPAHSLERAGERHALRIVNARNRRPVAVFVQTAQLALEVDSPHLRIGVAELQRAKRNPDLCDPARFGDARLHIPDAVPVRIVVAPFVRHLRIPLRAGRIGGELVPVAAVVKRVEHDAEAVAAAGVVVLLQVADDDLRRLHVVCEHAEVERVIGIEHAHISVVRRRVAFVRIRSE
jgi:hypothetical protein